MATKPTGRPLGRPKKELPPDDGSKPDLPEQAWRALAVEFAYGWIGVASLRRVAGRAGISQEAVRKWRNKPLYGRGFGWLLAEYWRRQDEGAEAERCKVQEKINARARARLPGWVAARWFGAARSMADGVVYDDPEAYARHLLKAKMLPVELLDEVRAEVEAEAARIAVST